MSACCVILNTDIARFQSTLHDMQSLVVLMSACLLLQRPGPWPRPPRQRHPIRLCQHASAHGGPRLRIAASRAAQPCDGPPAGGVGCSASRLSASAASASAFHLSRCLPRICASPVPHLMTFPSASLVQAACSRKCMFARYMYVHGRWPHLLLSGGDDQHCWPLLTCIAHCRRCTARPAHAGAHLFSPVNRRPGLGPGRQPPRGRSACAPAAASSPPAPARAAAGAALPSASAASPRRSVRCCQAFPQGKQPQAAPGPG